MKKLSIVLILMVILMGCSGMQPEQKDAIIIVVIESVSSVIGYYAAQSPDLDLALRAIYEEAAQGAMSPESVNKIIDRLDRDNELEQLLIRNILKLAELVGATVLNGHIVDIAGISPEFVNAVARGYVQGFDTFTLQEVRRETN